MSRLREALDQIDFVRRWVDAHPDRMALATTADGTLRLSVPLATRAAMA